MDREIQVMLAERAIAATMNDYCQAMDNGEHARWMDCFTADAVYEVSLPSGAVYATLNGTADLEKFIANYPNLPGHRHVYSTPVYEVDPDAGSADVSVYWFVVAGSEKGAGINSLGISLDKFVRGADGKWRMSARRVKAEGMSAA
jgi:ketosteroid isomerase-like protein